MKSKPKGARYRNLTLRGGVIYYERLTYGKRFRISTKILGGGRKLPRSL